MHGLYGGQPHDVTELKHIFLSAAGVPVALMTVYTSFAALSIRTCAGEGQEKAAAGRTCGGLGFIGGA